MTKAKILEKFEISILTQTLWSGYFRSSPISCRAFAVDNFLGLRPVLVYSLSWCRAMYMLAVQYLQYEVIGAAIITLGLFIGLVSVEKRLAGRHAKLPSCLQSGSLYFHACQARPSMLLITPFSFINFSVPFMCSNHLALITHKERKTKQ